MYLFWTICWGRMWFDRKQKKFVGESFEFHETSKVVPNELNKQLYILFTTPYAHSTHSSRTSHNILLKFLQLSFSEVPIWKNITDMIWFSCQWLELASGWSIPDKVKSTKTIIFICEKIILKHFSAVSLFLSSPLSNRHTKSTTLF